MLAGQFYRYSDGRTVYGAWNPEDGIYSDFEKCWNSLDIAEDHYRVIISKVPVDSNGDSIELLFDPKDRSRIYKFILSKYDLNEEDENLYAYCFDGMWFDFPLPFKKGDIIFNPLNHDGPLVFVGYSSIPEGVEDTEEFLRNHFDSSDMTVSGYYVNEKGKIYHEVGTDMMNYVYVPDNLLSGYQKLLVPVSDYVAGELSFDIMLNAVKYLNLQQKSKDLIFYSWYDVGVRTAAIDERLSENEDYKEISDILNQYE